MKLNDYINSSAQWWLYNFTIFPALLSWHRVNGNCNDSFCFYPTCMQSLSTSGFCRKTSCGKTSHHGWTKLGSWEATSRKICALGRKFVNLEGTFSTWEKFTICFVQNHSKTLRKIQMPQENKHFFFQQYFSCLIYFHVVFNESLKVLALEG